MEAGHFMSYQEFVTVYGPLLSFVMCFALITAIPHKWKDILSRKTHSVDIATPDIMRIMNFTSISCQTCNVIRESRKDV